MADSQRPRNPFAHSHDHDHHHHGHGHDHRHDDETLDDLDPAQQSLSDALRVSFSILKGIMVLLVVIYCFTGIFSVDASEVAIRLRFGRIVGDQVYTTGWHFGWPYPIERKIFVETQTLRTIRVDQPFWVETEGRAARALNPERDGSLLTGDANIVHARFDVIYKISDAIAFVTNVGEADPNDPMFRTVPYDRMAGADRLVRAAAEEGIVAAVARVDADTVLKKQRVSQLAHQHAQAVLDRLDTGITLVGGVPGADSGYGILVRDAVMPQNVRSAYYESNNAESQRAQLVSAARTERTTTLNAAAGSAHDALFRLIQSYEYHHAAGDLAMAEQTAEVLDEALERLEIDGLPIGGEVARIINEAKTYKTAVVEQIKGEVNTFQANLEGYRANPQLQKTFLWQNAREQVFGGEGVETFYQSGRPYVVINKDPQVQRRRQQERIRRAQEAEQPSPR